MNPAIVMLPTPLMASNFSTCGTFRIISSSTLLTASNCEVHKRCSSSSIYNSLFVPIPPSSPTLLCAASTRVFALSSVTPLPRIFLSCQIFRIPFTPSAITSFGNGAFSSTARPLIASNRVYNPRYSGKYIASHLWILFADMLCCFMIPSRLYTRSLISA